MKMLNAAVAAAMLAMAAAIAADPAAQGYDPMMRRPGSGAPVAPGAGPKDTADRDAVTLNPELGNLPDTPGAEETYYLCVGCHSLAIVKQQRISDARWDYLWDWMIEEQGMPEQDPETKQVILGYLKRHFSSER